MNDREHPRHIDVGIDAKYIIRFKRTYELSKGEYVYVCKGTPTELRLLQEDINSTFAPEPAKS